jgi:hypothetical protein
MFDDDGSNGLACLRDEGRRREGAGGRMDGAGTGRREGRWKAETQRPAGAAQTVRVADEASLAAAGWKCTWGTSRHARTQSAVADQQQDAVGNEGGCSALAVASTGPVRPTPIVEHGARTRRRASVHRLSIAPAEPSRQQAQSPDSRERRAGAGAEAAHPVISFPPPSARFFSIVGTRVHYWDWNDGLAASTGSRTGWAVAGSGMAGVLCACSSSPQLEPNGGTMYCTLAVRAGQTVRWLSPPPPPEVMELGIPSQELGWVARQTGIQLFRRVVKEHPWMASWEKPGGDSTTGRGHSPRRPPCWN